MTDQPATFGMRVMWSRPVAYQHGPRTFGRVRRGDRVFYRNYKRVIPGGLSRLDVDLEREATLRRLIRATIDREIAAVFAAHSA